MRRLRVRGGAKPKLRHYRRNRVYLLDPSGTLVSWYDKEELVPFGEYVPLASWLPFVRPIIAGEAPIVPGNSGGVLPVGSTRAGVLTCYEVLAPRLARQRRADGATVLLNLSNEAWFPGTAATEQLLVQAQLRAIEQRVAVVRVANEGVSAVIDVSGQVVWRGGPGMSLSHVATVAWGHERTFYGRTGDLTVWLATAAVAVAIGDALRRRHPAGG